MWRDRRILDLFGIEHPIIQAPMAGSVFSDMVIAVANAGGLGSLPCALLSHGQVRAEMENVRAGTKAPINMNFFCHAPPVFDEQRELAWRQRLRPYYAELGIDPAEPIPVFGLSTFDDTMCSIVEDLRPDVVSFHFGLPPEPLVARVKLTGAKVISSATTVREALWLEERGCDAIVAQGFEAGGHRGMFLAESVDQQVGTLALVPQVVDAVKVPVIAAGGIADARGIVASLALGASATQLGTAYLFCPEAKLAPPHRTALETARDDDTALTRIFTGRPARGVVNRLVREVGAMSQLPPEFPLAAGALMPLRGASEPEGSGDFMLLLAGQASRLGRTMPAAELTRTLAIQALERLGETAPVG